MVEAAAVKRKRVLVIEDDQLLNTLLMDKLSQLQLRDEGIEVHLAVNAEEGISMSREIRPDLILLDIILPGMTGFDFLEQLRREESLAQTPVVILSNLSGDADKDHAKRLGVVGYLVKSNFSLEEVMTAVEEVLQGHAIPTQENVDPEVKETPGGKIIYL